MAVYITMFFPPIFVGGKEGREEGRKAGREEGRKGGRKEGRKGERKEGREEGRKEGRPKEGKERKGEGLIFRSPLACTESSTLRVWNSSSTGAMKRSAFV